MLQLIIGARQARDVIALKQSYCEGGGLMAKMLECLLKRSQRGDFAPHLRKESQIPFPNVLTRVLLRVGQDRFGPSPRSGKRSAGVATASQWLASLLQAAGATALRLEAIFFSLDPAD